MNLLQQRILADGVVKSAEALDASAFLTKQIDAQLLNWCAKEIVAHFADANIDKVITIEAGGIAIGVLTALALGKPLVVCKKAASILDNSALYTAPVKSFTKNTEYTLSCDKAHVNAGDRLLFVDDFLAHGQALLGIQSVCQQAEAEFVGLGIVIEKSFQGGRQIADELGLQQLSLARLKSLENGVEFL
ncbi:xanthine phosphoribosyltransferase [Ferrimonas senticii]|uniref:xanthine phosphoribosyltransferase n=1 Tax=Ferrimonas senticii TaxID=394566 RepID=UPI0003FC40B0|nr:xanthine phosphoribosyltransferase [Ferrimonas senticii]